MAAVPDTTPEADESDGRGGRGMADEGGQDAWGEPEDQPDHDEHEAYVQQDHHAARGAVAPAPPRGMLRACRGERREAEPVLAGLMQDDFQLTLQYVLRADARASRARAAS